MPPCLVRVQCYFTFSNCKKFDRYSPKVLMHELRRFSLRLEDTKKFGSNTLYEQLLQNIQMTFGKFSPGLVSNGQPFCLYWKGNYLTPFTAFETSTELLEAIYDIIPIGTLSNTDETLETPIARQLLTICVCIRDKMSAEINRPGALFVNFPSTTTSAAATAESATQTSSTDIYPSTTSSTATAPPPPTSTPHRKKRVHSGFFLFCLSFLKPSVTNSLRFS